MNMLKLINGIPVTQMSKYFLSKTLVSQRIMGNARIAPARLARDILLINSVGRPQK